MGRRHSLRLEKLEDRQTPATFGMPWGDPRHLTLSFAPDQTPITGGGSVLFQTLNAQQPAADWQRELLRAELPPPGAAPAVQGFLVGLVLLLGFALPPLLRLRNVPALRVMRRETQMNASSYLSYLAGAAAFGGLLVWQAGDLKLGAYVVGGFAAAVPSFSAALGLPAMKGICVRLR